MLTGKEEDMPVLIAGQGLTGTLLSFALFQRNIPHTVIDPFTEKAASMLAAGIINPITGRRLSLSWNIDKLLIHAKTVYQQLEKTTHQQLFHICGLRAVYPDQDMKDAWLARSKSPEHAPWIDLDASLPNVLESQIKADLGTVYLPKAVRVDLPLLVRSWRSFLSEKGCLIQENFQHDALKIADDALHYKGQQYSHLICCEGYQVNQNPWFSNLPLRPNRGQRFIIKVEGLQLPTILRKYGLTAPLDNDQYWFGATHEWDSNEQIVSQKGLAYLSDNLNKTFNIPWQLISHEAAIRPTISDRKPVVGFHPEVKRIGIINGMGTKGASLAPFHTSAMADFLAFKHPLPAETLPDRFY